MRSISRHGFPGTGFAGTGFPGTGFAGTGIAGTGFAGIGLLAFAAVALTACSPADDASSAASGAADAQTGADSPYKPVATVRELMRGPVELSAEIYWDSVSSVMDAEGWHDYMPETDEEWIEVWSAGITLAESGNLLMMPPRAIDDPEWQQYARELVDIGLAAAQAAADHDFDGVLEHGEYILNSCNTCHRKFVPALPDI